MSQQVHVLCLGPARLRGSYRDYKSGLYLTFPEKVVGSVPFGADLTALITSIRMNQIIDVNGTVVAEYEAAKSGIKPDPVPVPARVKDPAKAKVKVEAKIAVSEPINEPVHSLEQEPETVDPAPEKAEIQGTDLSSEEAETPTEEAEDTPGDSDEVNDSADDPFDAPPDEVKPTGKRRRRSSKNK
jgi:hypothetical protein